MPPDGSDCTLGNRWSPRPEGTSQRVALALRHGCRRLRWRHLVGRGNALGRPDRLGRRRRARHQSQLGHEAGIESGRPESSAACQRWVWARLAAQQRHSVHIVRSPQSVTPCSASFAQTVRHSAADVKSTGRQSSRWKFTKSQISGFSPTGPDVREAPKRRCVSWSPDAITAVCLSGVRPTQ